MADDGGTGGNAANSGQGQGGTPTAFTQDQVNHFMAETKRNALGGFFKELGLESVPSVDDLKGIFSKATEYDKVQQGQKTDVERLTGQLSESNKKAERVPELETVIRRQKLAADASLPTTVWEFIKGGTDDEIKESIKGLKVILKLEDNTDQQPQQQPGVGGRPPAPNPQQGATPGAPAGRTMQAGIDAYKARHKTEE